MGKERFRRSVVTPGVNLGPAEIRAVSIPITAAQLKTARATPITLVPAPGAGFVVQMIWGNIVYKYGAVFVESGANLAVKYTNGSGDQVSQTVESTGFIDATTDQMRPIVPLNDAALVGNAALVLHNVGASEISGTGSAMRVVLKYALVPTGL